LTLNDMLSRLAAAQRKQRALVSDTAHELRSPIASIRAQLEVALDHPELQDWESTARDVHADTLRLAQLAEDLLLLARLDERSAGASDRGRRVPLDLAVLVADVAARYEGAKVTVVTMVVAPRGGQEARQTGELSGGEPASAAIGAKTGQADSASAGEVIGAAATHAPIIVAGDRDGLDRLLVNLIDNAVRYAASRVTVAARADGQWAELTVTDDGPGIPAADLERAFDRFARLDSARSRDADAPGGAGLGLAIVRATAGAHGGTARLESARGQPGLRAVVHLPRHLT
jgi:signal transduction histidine kinase